MTSMMLRADKITVAGVPPVVNENFGVDFPIATGGTTAVKMDNIATSGTTSKTLTVEASRQYWQTITTTTGSVTLKLNLDGSKLADKNAAEVVLRWPNSGAYIGTIEIIIETVTVWSFTINQGTPSAVVKIAKIGGEIVTSYVK